MGRCRVARRVLAASLAVLLVWLGSCGPRGLDRYPAREGSPYRLPFHGRRWVCQGNNGVVSHHGWQEFAYDFSLPEDTPILAAREGVVVETRGDREGFGPDRPANHVAVEHADGTRAWYLHLRKVGVLVKVGQRVAQGQEIARSGWTGRAMIPHLHFHVTDRPGSSIPVTFADADADGIPRSPWFAGRD